MAADGEQAAACPTRAPHGIMVMAGEASGDLLGAELVTAFRRAPIWQTWAHAPRVFGAGGPSMAGAGVDLEIDLTRHAVVGLTEVLRQLGHFRRLMQRLTALAVARQPDVIIGIDFSGFNRRLIRAIRSRLPAPDRVFSNWRPRFVQYVSPQVWASRPRRAYGLARDLDLLLCLFPFEKDWYAQRVPQLRVEWVGHPLIDRHAARPDPGAGSQPSGTASQPTVVLLPGSRLGELRAHVPLLLETVRRLQEGPPLRFQMVLPSEALRRTAEQLGAGPAAGIALVVGGLGEALSAATVALASTGTVTLECALHSVPTVAFYRTSWATYQIARRLVTVAFAAMPNLLANDAVFPEFIQDAATPESLSQAASALLRDEPRRTAIRAQLRQIVAMLGEPGASDRAAAAILRLATR